MRRNHRLGRSGWRRGTPAWGCLGLLLTSASCVPAISEAPHPEFAMSVASADVADRLPDATHPVIANASIPLADAPNPAPASYVFRARSALDQMRSLDCLAEAVYYEARSETEEGQRAVAQVVLNRVRHPAWPNSVCGVVYQGPAIPGGGCQFSFTCDGSLNLRPSGSAWARARWIAGEALAGKTYAGVGHSTHYHTHEVLPGWARRLAKTAVIGAHNFYRLPGAWGGPSSFRATYAGREPLPVPAVRTSVAIPERASSRASASTPSAAIAAPDAMPEVRYTEFGRAASQVREEYLHSGQWREDAPAAITGR